MNKSPGMDPPGGSPGLTDAAHEGNILEFRARKPEDAPITLKPTNYDGCQHKRFTLVIDDHLRTVECSGCGVTLDPVQCLMDWASFYRKVDRDYIEMAKRVGTLEAWKRKIDKQPETARMTDAERKMDFAELRAQHSDNGCPKERMWIDRRGMISCYCGVGHNAQFYPKLAEEVLAAHEAARRCAQFLVSGRAEPQQEDNTPVTAPGPGGIEG